MRVRLLETIDEHDIAGLTDVLMDCIEGGASVSFMWPMTRAKGEAFWRDAAASAVRGERVIVVAEDESGMIGTVSVVWAKPENQPHRADIAKMLVRRSARGQGVGAALLAESERQADAAGKTLLVLDTVKDEAGHRLYMRAGWTLSGEIPDYALWPDGRPCAVTVFYKALRGSGAHK